jgi:hypothetical protein
MSQKIARIADYFVFLKKMNHESEKQVYEINRFFEGSKPVTEIIQTHIVKQARLQEARTRKKI